MTHENLIFVHYICLRYYSPQPLFRMVGIDLLVKIRYQNQILHNEAFEGMVAYVNVEPLTRWTDTPETMHGDIIPLLSVYAGAGWVKIPQSVSTID
jgi:hypothetical protein